MQLFSRNNYSVAKQLKANTLFAIIVQLWQQQSLCDLVAKSASFFASATLCQSGIKSSFCVCVCLSVCHKSEFYKNGRTMKLAFFFRPIPYCLS